MQNSGVRLCELNFSLRGFIEAVYMGAKITHISFKELKTIHEHPFRLGKANELHRQRENLQHPK